MFNHFTKEKTTPIENIYIYMKGVMLSAFKKIKKVFNIKFKDGGHNDQ